MPIKSLKSIGTRALGQGLGGDTEATEPHFNQTVLLLHADGSEGAGNTSALGDPNYKAFRDNSTLTHAIVVNGDAYGNDFSPYYYADGYWSRFSDSSTNSDQHGSGVTLGTNNFTIGMFVYPIDSSGGTSGSTISSRTALYADTGANTVIIAHDQLLINAGSLWTITINYTTDIVLNQWQWIQVDRTGSTFRVSIDGSYVDGGGATSSGTIPAITTGTFGERAGQADYTGYFSNFILINGANRGSIATPTSPLTADSDTALLLHQSNRLVNNGNTSVTLTSGGDNKISTNTPFTQSKTANVGSGFFDTSGDYLELTGIDFTDFNFGTGEFLIEGWIYYNSQSLGSANAIVGQTGWGNVLQLTSSGYLQFYQAASSGNSGTYWITGTSALPIGSWTHFALQRDSSGNLDLWVNGTREATNTTYSSTTMQFHSAKGNITVHHWYGQNSSNSEYISDLRIKNSAVYTSGASITVPTSSFTSDSNTKLLTMQYSGAVRNVGFVDDSKYNHLVTRIGDSNMGTFSPFSLEDGYWSVYGDSGNTDYVKYPIASLQALGSGVYTIEFWAYLTIPTSNSNWRPFFGASNGAGANPKFNLHDGGSSVLTLEDNGGTLFSTGNVRSQYTNQWCHIAVVREGTGTNQTYIYVNGSKEGTGTHDKDLSNITNDSAGFRIGRNPEDHQQSLDGYISNFKMTAAVLYSGSSFTVPTTPLTLTSQGSSSSDVKLLTHQSNRFLDNSSTGYAPTTVNSPKVIPFSPFAPSRSYTKDVVGGSAYFDGSTDGLVLTDAAQPIGTNNFEVEFWYYPIGSSNNGYVFNTSHNNTSFGPILIYVVSLDVRLYSSSTGGSWNVHNHISLGTAKANSWNHIYLSRVSNAFYGFVNGVASASNGTTWDTDFTIATAPVHISTYNSSGSGSAYGYVANVQYNIGSGSTTKSVPTAPTTPDSDTYVQLNFDNAGIIDHTMKNNLDTEGNTRISTRVKKFGTGSIYLDGSDELNINDTTSETFHFGTGLFTVEAFIRVESGSSSSGQWFTNEGHGGWGAGGIAIYLQSAITVWFNDYSAGAPFMTYDGNYDDGVIRHFVIVRGTSGACAVFVNGTRVVTGTHTGNVGRTGGMGIGNYKGSSRYLTGYIDEMRVTKGVARYDPSQSSVTVPTKAFANR